MTKNTPPKRRALVDLDGTVADYSKALRRDELAILSPGETPRLEPEAEDEYPYVKLRRRIIKSQPGWWRNLEPIESGLRIVRMMEELGFRITVLTRGPRSNPNAWAEKVDWVKIHMPPSSRVCVMDDEKAIVYGRVLMDDWIPYVKPWLRERPRGLVIMPDQPWNQGYTHPQVIRDNGTNDEEIRAALIAQRDRPADDGDED